MKYSEIQQIVESAITLNSDILPYNAFDAAMQLHIRVKNSIECKKDFNGTSPLIDCNALYSLYNGEYIIYYDEHYPYYNFAIAHEIAHHLLKHTTDGINEHMDAQIAAAMIIAPIQLIKKHKIRSAEQLSLICKIPIDVADEYWHYITTYVYPHISIYTLIIFPIACVMVILSVIILIFINPDETTEAPVQTPIQTSTTKEIVYVTPNGKKYHKQNCYHIDSSNTIAMSIEDAVSLGYTPCKDCS